MLSQLESLPLLHQVAQTVLHRQSILQVHLELVANPIAIAQGQKLLGQLVVAGLHGLVIGHVLLGI